MFQFKDLHQQTEEQRQEALAQAHEVLNRAAHILVGAGAGLSVAGGLTVGGSRFTANFGPFIQRYGFTDMYMGGFYPFTCEEDRWAWWGQHLWLETHDNTPNPLYAQIVDYLRGRDYFIITTNVDEQFALAGANKSRIYAMQGRYGFTQCAQACHQKVYDARATCAAIHDDLGGVRTRISDSGLVPTCPVCGGPMNPWLRIDSTFVQDDNWYAAQKRYNDWLARCDAHDTVLLELGVGFNTPVIIRYPFERMAQRGCTLIRMNYDSAAIDALSIECGISLQGDIAALWPQVVRQTKEVNCDE